MNLPSFNLVQLNIQTLLRQQQEEDFHQYSKALDPTLQQYSRSSEEKNNKTTSARMSGFAFCPLQQPATHALPTDLWTAVTQSQEAR